MHNYQHQGFYKNLTIIFLGLVFMAYIHYSTPFFKNKKKLFILPLILRIKYYTFILDANK